jgi:hypothetical protein
MNEANTVPGWHVNSNDQTIIPCQPGTVFASFIADSKFLVGIVAPCELSVNVPLMINENNHETTNVNQPHRRGKRSVDNTPSTTNTDPMAVNTSLVVTFSL